MANLGLLDANRAGRPGEDLERKLHRTILGQDEAARSQTLLFLGPTGTGKTRVVEATAEALLGTRTRSSKSTAPNIPEANR
jgi:ATP-dependent Clp protease ATP-binding subunit ClpA